MLVNEYIPKTKITTRRINNFPNIKDKLNKKVNLIALQHNIKNRATKN